MLEATGLECLRGERLLFRDLSFVLSAGDLLRVEGPNGSGKTTLLRLVCGLIRPDAGTLRWAGAPVFDETYRARLLYVGHLNALKDDLSAVENLRSAAALQGATVDRAEALAALEAMGLASLADMPVRLLSQGQKRRVALARLELGAARPLWLLDEPFAALDTAASARLAVRLGTHLRQGGMVMYTTHQDVPIEAPRRATLGLGS